MVAFPHLRNQLNMRLSTDAQTIGNQISELREVAEHRGWQVVEIYKDAGISGARGRGRGQRPGLDAVLTHSNCEGSS